MKFSSAHIPPEMIYLDDITGLETVVGPKATKRASLKADIKIDLWAFGTILYQLCSGEPLFLCNDEDQIDQETRKLLRTWPTRHKQAKLAKVSDLKARNLVSRLLSRDPAARPASIAHVLGHPFFTGAAVPRMVGECAEFDVFISYRVKSDQDHAEFLYTNLTERGLKVWMDKHSLVSGKKWAEGFADGLLNSKAFVPILSPSALEGVSALSAESLCDNVFLEYTLALEFVEFGLLTDVFPVMVGRTVPQEKTKGEEGQESPIHNRHYGNFFADAAMPPDVSVNSIESEVIAHMDRLGLGSPLLPKLSCKAMMSRILSFQGALIENDGYSSWHAALDGILAVKAGNN
jgi:serine/threonine protein kinase